MKATYSVIVLSQTTFSDSRGPVIERRCGHHHKSLAAACRCLWHLTGADWEGWRPAAWDRAVVRRSDGSRLTDGEGEELLAIEAEKRVAIGARR